MPDRISRLVRNGFGEVTQQRSGVGTGLDTAEVSATYRPNGQAETVTDGEGNMTTYVFDGHDRLSRTRYPDDDTDGTSSATDYEELTYDAASNVTNRRLRDGQSHGFTYDGLNRVTLMNLPGTEPDIGYGYDLLGRITSASRTGHALSFTHDALGRQLTETSPNGTVTSAYDLAGRRTKPTRAAGLSARCILAR
jgi:YD repeat-containing protein